MINNENKITYLRHKNCRQVRSINKGVLISTGELITVIDADDKYKPNHLSACLSKINSLDLIASTTGTIFLLIKTLLALLLHRRPPYRPNF